MKMTRAWLVAALLLLSPAASAQTKSGSSVELFIERSGGGYEVAVSPHFVTVFYLPEKAIRALASNQKDFDITVMKDTVVVRPLKDQVGLTANLNIDMKSVRVSVVLRVGKPEEAVAQVIFTREKEKAEIDRKVEAALAPLRAELEEKKKNVEAEVRAAADLAVAEAMVKSFVVQEIDAVARDGGGVVARVPRAARVGDSVYVHFTLQNRSGAPYLLREAAAVQEGQVIAGRTAFLPRERKILAGESGRGVVVIPSTGLAAGKAFVLRLTQEPGGQTLSVSGLRAP
jgi:hypothetical protein